MEKMLIDIITLLFMSNKCLFDVSFKENFLNKNEKTLLLSSHFNENDKGWL